MSDATLPAGSHRAEERTVAILEELFSGIGGRTFDVRLWTGRILEADAEDDPPFTLVLTHPGSLRCMLLPPGELTLAEAYLRGDFDVEGDIVALMAQAEKFENLSLSDWFSLLRQARSLPKTDPPQRYESGRQPLRSPPHPSRPLSIELSTNATHSGSTCGSLSRFVLLQALGKLTDVVC